MPARTNQSKISLASEEKSEKNNSSGPLILMNSAFSNLSLPHGMRRSQSAGSNLTPRSVRVVVLGAGGVGKTAMSVRFVTKRFIGDYDPTLETIYRHTTVVDDQLVNFEIMDTAGQADNPLMLEDKCKWGESFIFVYDVTDKYSFDELTRLKFIASYTHSKLRANFTPCWVLVGNKSDLASHERMVSFEEGVALARDLGCHVFREISVKESMNESSEVFESLWREFSRLSPRSPSSSHRRKNSCRIQDKISVLNSHACTCASEVLKHGVHGCSDGPDVVSCLTNSLKRHTSVPFINTSSTRQCKDTYYNDANNNERLDVTRNISCIPENLKEDDNEEEEVDVTPPSIRPQRLRRNAVASGALQPKNQSLSSFSRRQPLSKAMSVDNVFTSVDLNSCSDTTSSFMISSSTSSSSSSLNGSSSPSASSGGLRMKVFDSLRPRSGPDILSGSKNFGVSPQTDELVSLYHEHCRRTRARKRSSSKFNRSLTINSYKATCEELGS